MADAGRHSPHGTYHDGASSGDGADLRTLFSRLNRDATQLAHDEIDLLKMEIRDVADTLSSDLQQAGRTLVRDLGKMAVALTLASLAGLALTTGAILAIGALLDGAYWAGALIVGVLYLIAAAIFGKSAAGDLQANEALRLENTRRVAARDRQVIAEEARRTKQFAQHEVQEFRQHAGSGGDTPRVN